MYMFFISMMFRGIYRLRVGDFLITCQALCWALQNTIMLSIFLGSMNFSILAIIFSVTNCKTFSFWFVKNAAKQMALKWFFMRISYCNWTRTHNDLVHKRTPNHLSKLTWFHTCFRFHGCFEQGFPWHSGNYRVWIHSKNS